MEITLYTQSLSNALEKGGCQRLSLDVYTPPHKQLQLSGNKCIRLDQATRSLYIIQLCNFWMNVRARAIGLHEDSLAMGGKAPRSIASQWKHHHHDGTQSIQSKEPLRITPKEL